MGCLLGGLGQELSGISETFRKKIEECFSVIASRIAACLDIARERGEIPAGGDTQRMATLLVDCWEGAALRSRLRGNADPLNAMLEFYFATALSSSINSSPAPPPAPRAPRSARPEPMARRAGSRRRHR